MMIKEIIPERIMVQLRKLKEFYKYNFRSRAKSESLHWIKKKKKVGNLYEHQYNRYKKCLEIFNSLSLVESYDKVIDIGSGPSGGILDLIEAKEKWIVEPIYSRYKKSGVLCHKSDVIVRETDGESMVDVPRDYFDAVFTVNAIDHGDDIGKCISNISDILKPGGKLFVHVHCREPKELNSLHRQSFSSHDLQEIFNRNNFDLLNHKIYKIDPLSTKHTAFIGVLQKK